jgi:hypothetical protein
LPTISAYLPAAVASDKSTQELAQQIAGIADDTVIAASDAGSHHQIVTACGMAVGDQAGPKFKAGYELDGFDQTVWAGEFDGAVTVLKAAAAAGKNVHLLIDSKSVQVAIATIVSGRRVKLPRYGFGRWREAMLAVEGRTHTSEWIPSHGKKDGWRAGHLSTSLCREYNRVADLTAGEQLQLACRRRRYPQYLRDCEEAESWAAKALQHWHKTAEFYIRNHPDLVFLDKYWFGLPQEL